MKIKRLFIAIFFLTAIACSFSVHLPLVTPATVAPAGSGPNVIPVTGATSTSTSTSTSPYIPPQCIGTPVATLPAATAEALPTPSAGTNPQISKDEQLRLLDEIAAPVPSLYVYPDLNGLNWPATVAKYRAKIEAGLDTDAFYTEMNNMITELGDDHSQYESPAEVAQAAAELSGHNDYVGIGVQVVPSTARGAMSVVLVFPGSAADHAGLKPHDDLISVDGLPLLKNGTPSVQLVRGPSCSAAVLTVESPGGSPHPVTMVRYAVNSALPITAQLVTTHDGSRIGYIFIPSFFDETIPGQIRQALQNFGQLDGLILDNRMNPGGSSDVVEPIISFFTDGLVGNFVSRTDKTPLTVKADPVANSQTVPLVILVGDDTVSFGEIFSGLMRDIGRAKVVGKTTQGNVEILNNHTFSDGSRLWLAQERFVELHSQDDWEKTGIVPDVQAFADWDTFTFDTDPAIAASVKLLGHQ